VGDAAAGGAALPSAGSAHKAEWASQRTYLRAVSGGIVAAVAESAQRHVSLLLSRRRDNTSGLKVADVKAVWDAVTGFTSAAGAVLAQAGLAGLPGRGAGGASSQHLHAASPALQEVLQQAKALLAAFHKRNSAALGAMLEAEQWKAAEVPQQVQAIADAIADSIGASSHHRAVSALLPKLASEPGSAGAAQGASAPPAAAPQSAVLRVKGASFHVAGTGVMLVKMLGDYCALAEAVPEVTADAVIAIVELLRLFNSRSAQLVLGAGAVQSAGLRRITAKHLAVSAQTLDAVLALLPSIRGALVMRLPPSQHVLLQELARVTADFMQHEQRLMAKFVAIVKDLFGKVVGDMQALGWGDAGVPLPIPTPPMRELIRGICTLHKILLPLLRPDQLHDVVCRVGNLLAAQAPSHYAALLSQATAGGRSGAGDAAAAARAAGGGGGSGDGDGLTIVTLTSFSSLLDRSVASERMAADLRALCDALDDITAEGAAEGPTQAEVAVQAAADASGLATAASTAPMPSAVLRAWLRRQFGDSAAAAVASPPVAAVSSPAAQPRSPASGAAPAGSAQPSASNGAGVATDAAAAPDAPLSEGALTLGGAAAQPPTSLAVPAPTANGCHNAGLPLQEATAAAGDAPIADGAGAAAEALEPAALHTIASAISEAGGHADYGSGSSSTVDGLHVHGAAESAVGGAEAVRGGAEEVPASENQVPGTEPRATANDSALQPGGRLTP
jgi:vacuolar protein sorting-associated protein 54